MAADTVTAIDIYICGTTMATDIVTVMVTDSGKVMPTHIVTAKSH